MHIQAILTPRCNNDALLRQLFDSPPAVVIFAPWRIWSCLRDLRSPCLEVGRMVSCWFTSQKAIVCVTLGPRCFAEFFAFFTAYYFSCHPLAFSRWLGLQMKTTWLNIAFFGKKATVKSWQLPKH